MAAITHHTTILPVRGIQYDRTTGDYRMTLDGELIGYAKTHHDAEVALDAVVHARPSHSPLTEVEALAHELVALYPGLEFPAALDIASRKIDQVLAYAADYDDAVARASFGQRLTTARRALVAA
jgi:hypothetical protein